MPIYNYPWKLFRLAAFSSRLTGCRLPRIPPRIRTLWICSLVFRCRLCLIGIFLCNNVLSEATEARSSALLSESTVGSEFKIIWDWDWDTRLSRGVSSTIQERLFLLGTIFIKSEPAFFTFFTMLDTKGFLEDKATIRNLFYEIYKKN